MVDTEEKRISNIIEQAVVIDGVEVDGNQIIPTNLHSFEKTQGQTYYYKEINTLFKMLPNGLIISFKPPENKEQPINPKNQKTTLKETEISDEEISKHILDLREEIVQISKDMIILQDEIKELEQWKEETITWQNNLIRWAENLQKHIKQKDTEKYEKIDST